MAFAEVAKQEAHSLRWYPQRTQLFLPEGTLGSSNFVCQPGRGPGVYRPLYFIDSLNLKALYSLSGHQSHH